MPRRDQAAQQAGTNLEPIDDHSHDHSHDDAAPASDADDRQPRGPGLAAKLLMAAMVGLREGLELGRRDPEPTIMLADGLSTADLPLDFGPLPPLD